MSKICLDCEALNELLRRKTGMGQGEIDSETEDIKTELKARYKQSTETKRTKYETR